MRQAQEEVSKAATVGFTSSWFKALLHWAILLATGLAILMRHKMHESLPSVTCPEMNMTHSAFTKFDKFSKLVF